MSDISVIELAILDVAVNGINPLEVYMSDEFEQFHGRRAGLAEADMRAVIMAMEKKGWIMLGVDPANGLAMTETGGTVWCEARDVNFDLYYRSYFQIVEVDGKTEESVSIEAYNPITCWEVAGASIVPLLNRQDMIELVDFRRVDGRLHYWRQPTTFYRLSYFRKEEFDEQEIERYEEHLRRRGIWAGRPEW